MSSHIKSKTYSLKKNIFSCVVMTSFLLGTAWANDAKTPDMNNSQSITLLTNKIIDVQSLPNGTNVITVPDGAKVIKKPGEAPYCLIGCDVPIDCKGNKPPAPQGKQWACDNKKGACVGKCYLTSATLK